MKKIALYIILFSYSSVILKPVSPYLSDTIAHIFYYARHMATVHYQNGKFHVHREIMANAKKAEKQNETPLSKNNNSTGDHILIKLKEFTACPESSVFYFHPPSPALPDNYLQGNYPPPRAC